MLQAVRRSAVAFICGLSFLSFASQARAWNKPGHMICGAIAYDVLRQESPKALAAALAVLRQHPQYNDIIAARLQAVPTEDRDRYLFMIASRWPDDIRKDKDYDHPVWHYIDFPYVPPGQPDSVQGEAPGPQNAVVAIQPNLETLRSTAPAAERAVALCWVMHCVGDVHQPLHAVSLYTTDYPQGDHGGNSFFVRVKEDRAVTNLHSLWDDLFTSSEKYTTTAKIAADLRARPEFAKAKLTELSHTDVEKWAGVESFNIARHVVYRDGKLAGSADRATGPVLPADYLSNAKDTAERRMVLAGYRLAKAIETALGKK